MVWKDRSLSILKPFLVQFFTSSDTNKVLSCFQWRISWPTIWHFQQDASDISLIGGRFNILNKVSGYWRTCMHKQESQFYNISDNGRPINIKVKQVWRTTYCSHSTKNNHNKPAEGPSPAWWGSGWCGTSHRQRRGARWSPASYRSWQNSVKHDIKKSGVFGSFNLLVINKKCN